MFLPLECLEAGYNPCRSPLKLNLILYEDLKMIEKFRAAFQILHEGVRDNIDEYLEQFKWDELKTQSLVPSLKDMLIKMYRRGDLLNPKLEVSIYKDDVETKVKETDMKNVLSIYRAYVPKKDKKAPLEGDQTVDSLNVDLKEYRAKKKQEHANRVKQKIDKIGDDEPTRKTNALTNYVQKFGVTKSFDMDQAVEDGKKIASKKELIFYKDEVFKIYDSFMTGLKGLANIDETKKTDQASLIRASDAKNKKVIDPTVRLTNLERLAKSAKEMLDKSETIMDTVKSENGVYKTLKTILRNGEAGKLVARYEMLKAKLAKVYSSGEIENIVQGTVAITNKATKEDDEKTRTLKTEAYKAKVEEARKRMASSFIDLVYEFSQIILNCYKILNRTTITNYKLDRGTLLNKEKELEDRVDVLLSRQKANWEHLKTKEIIELPTEEQKRKGFDIKPDDLDDEEILSKSEFSENKAEVLKLSARIKTLKKEIEETPADRKAETVGKTKEIEELKVKIGELAAKQKNAIISIPGLDDVEEEDGKIKYGLKSTLETTTLNMKRFSSGIKASTKMLEKQINSLAALRNSSAKNIEDELKEAVALAEKGKKNEIKKDLLPLLDSKLVIEDKAKMLKRMQEDIGKIDNMISKIEKDAIALGKRKLSPAEIEAEIDKDKKELEKNVKKLEEVGVLLSKTRYTKSNRVNYEVSRQLLDLLSFDSGKNTESIERPPNQLLSKNKETGKVYAPTDVEEAREQVRHYRKLVENETNETKKEYYNNILKSAEKKLMRMTENSVPVEKENDKGEKVRAIGDAPVYDYTKAKAGSFYKAMAETEALSPEISGDLVKLKTQIKDYFDKNKMPTGGGGFEFPDEKYGKMTDKEIDKLPERQRAIAKNNRDEYLYFTKQIKDIHMPDGSIATKEEELERQKYLIAFSKNNSPTAEDFMKAKEILTNMQQNVVYHILGASVGSAGSQSKDKGGLEGSFGEKVKTIFKSISDQAKVIKAANVKEQMDLKAKTNANNLSDPTKSTRTAKGVNAQKDKEFTQAQLDEIKDHLVLNGETTGNQVFLPEFKNKMLTDIALIKRGKLPKGHIKVVQQFRFPAFNGGPGTDTKTQITIGKTPYYMTYNTFRDWLKDESPKGLGGFMKANMISGPSEIGMWQEIKKS
jgi:hypothetical protein